MERVSRGSGTLTYADVEDEEEHANVFVPLQMQARKSAEAAMHGPMG